MKETPQEREKVIKDTYEAFRGPWPDGPALRLWALRPSQVIDFRDCEISASTPLDQDTLTYERVKDWYIEKGKPTAERVRVMCEGIVVSEHIRPL
jgi:hypothetical protein